MTKNPPHSPGQHLPAAPGRPREETRSSSPRGSRAVKAATRQKAGKRMIVAGFVISVVGVVLYCVTSFAGDLSAEMGDVLFRNAVPYARATLALVGLGTLVWLVGSVTYMRVVADGDEAGGSV